MRTLCLALSLLLPLVCGAQNVMTWLMTDLPPASIRVGGRPSDGMTDVQVDYIKAHWPEVEHRIIYANLKRAWALIESGQSVCYTFTLITPQRQTQALIVPTTLLPPLQLIFRRDAARSLPLTKQHEVDLDQLLAHHELRGLLSEKRSFGTAIDRSLRLRPADATLDVTPVSSYAENIFTRLLLNRADYTIDYDFVHAYHLSRDPMLQELQTLPISASSDPIKVGIACPRTSWGKATADKIDSILGSREGVQMLRKSTERWLSSESRGRYSEPMNAFYRLREKPMLGQTSP